MKKHLTLLSLLLVTACAFSQVPGYQGKKFSIKYDCGINHPVLVGRSGSWPMLYHNASLDYVVARAWTIGVKYGFMTYNAPPDKTLFSNYTYSYDKPVNAKDYKGRYTQHTVSFIAKKFFIRKGYLAPVGRYVLLGAYYQYVTDHLVQLTEEYGSGGTYTTKFLGHKGTAHFGGVSVGLGRNFIVARRMLIDIGCTVSFSPYFNTRGYSKQEKVVYNDLMLRNLFQLRLGLGFLAF